MCFLHRSATMWDLQRLLFSWSQMEKTSTCMHTAWWGNIVRMGSALWTLDPRTWWSGKWGYMMLWKVGAGRTWHPRTLTEKALFIRGLSKTLRGDLKMKCAPSRRLWGVRYPHVRDSLRQPSLHLWSWPNYL